MIFTKVEGHYLGLYVDMRMMNVDRANVPR